MSEEQLVLQELQERALAELWSRRWDISADMTRDGMFTISDLLKHAEYLFLIPGDGILFALSLFDPLRTFFELSPESYGGWFSWIISTWIWYVAFNRMITPGSNSWRT